MQPGTQRRSIVTAVDAAGTTRAEPPNAIRHRLGSEHRNGVRPSTASELGEQRITVESRQIQVGDDQVDGVCALLVERGLGRVRLEHPIEDPLRT